MQWRYLRFVPYKRKVYSRTTVFADTFYNIYAMCTNFCVIFKFSCIFWQLGASGERGQVALFPVEKELEQEFGIVLMANLVYMAAMEIKAINQHAT